MAMTLNDSSDAVIGVDGRPAAADGSPGVTFPEWAAGNWHVLHVKSRQEKALGDDLAAMGVSHYLPLLREGRVWGKSIAQVDVPLFPGYVFLKGTLDEAYRADRTKRVARIIPVVDQARLDRELRDIRLALSHGKALEPYPFLRNGVRVEIRAGPLRGLRGLIEGRSPSNRLILQVGMLGTAVSLEIDGALLEPIAA